MTDEEKKVVAEAISTLLLADHMGDAHEAGMELAWLIWGDEGADAYVASAGYRATPKMREFLYKWVPEIWNREDEGDE